VLLLVVLSGLSACATSDSDPRTSKPRTATMPRTVLITRHAEKADFSADPALSDQGLRRAEALSLLPEAQSVGTIITTQYRRTTETGAPLAIRQGILSRVVNATASPESLRLLTQEILASADPNAENGAVLVVGHSNTVPLIIRELGGPGDMFLTEEDFGDLFILTIDDDGTVDMKRMRYGD
jgi:broad specificity phosphatase PhoE